MIDDTAIGGKGDRFPLTHLSAIAGVRSDDPDVRGRAFELIVAAYWKPIYKYVRIKWNKSNEDAKDLTQGFFARALEKSFFEGYDPKKARFRTFVRVCLDGYLSNEAKAAARLKRGGDVTMLALDFDGAELELTNSHPRASDAPDDYFEREWARNLFSLAVDTLRDECEVAGKTMHFALFERYYLDDAGETGSSYQQLGSEFGISVSNVTNYLAFARREFRRIVLERLRDLSGSEEEFQREARNLLGIDPR
jgi:RNA polymerase sigma factor (sigma-70 family)